MGTFAGFAGEKNIPDNKKEEFEKALIKILNYGGMMSLEPVRMYNKEVGLISPVQLGEDGTVTFHYNYFEDDSWEDAGYCEKGLWSNKVGSAEFNDVMMTAYTLYEFYNEAYGYASLGNEPAPYLECYIGWINHLLKTEFSMMARRNIWELFETENIRRSRIEYSRSLSYDDAQHIVPDSLKWAAPVTELADMYLISEGYEDFIAFSEAFPEYKAEIKEAKQCLKEYFGEEGQEEKFTELLGLLSKSMSERQQETGPLKRSLRAVRNYRHAILYFWLRKYLGNVSGRFGGILKTDYILMSTFFRLIHRNSFLKRIKHGRFLLNPLKRHRSWCKIRISLI